MKLRDFVFRGKQADEQIMFLIEKHWIVHLPEILYALLLFIVTGVFFWLYAQYPSAGAYFFCFIMWPVVLMYLLLTILIAFLDDRLDLLLITNKRIIDITQVKFLNRDVSEASLNQIQDVKGRVKGIVSAVFGIGTISIQTAGRNVNFEIDHVGKPVQKARHILDVSYKYRASLLDEEVQAV